MSKTTMRSIEEGAGLARVEITMEDDESPWSPHVRKEDIKKLDRVRLVLRRGDIEAAAREAIVFELKPVATEPGEPATRSTAGVKGREAAE